MTSPAGLKGAAYPGSRSGIGFHRNRSWRLSSAHQGMKTGGAGFCCSDSPWDGLQRRVFGLGRAVGAPLAGDKPPRYGAHPHPNPLPSRARGKPLRIGGDGMFSWQSLMAAAAGTPKYENGVGCWNRSGGIFAAPATPLDSGFRRNDELRGPEWRTRQI